MFFRLQQHFERQVYTLRSAQFARSDKPFQAGFELRQATDFCFDFLFLLFLN